jgi:hypothetical protein
MFERFQAVDKNACEIVKKLEGKRPFGRHRRRWKDNIKTDLKRRCGLNSSVSR